MKKQFYLKLSVCLLQFKALCSPPLPLTFHLLTSQFQPEVKRTSQNVRFAKSKRLIIFCLEIAPTITCLGTPSSFACSLGQRSENEDNLELQNVNINLVERKYRLIAKNFCAHFEICATCKTCLKIIVLHVGKVQPERKYYDAFKMSKWVKFAEYSLDLLTFCERVFVKFSTLHDRNFSNSTLFLQIFFF